MAEEKSIEKKEMKNLSEIAKGALVPPVDIYEDEQGVTLFADLPGVARDSLNLEIDKDTLQIYGKTIGKTEPDGEFYYAEFPAKDYCRAFTIGDEIDRSQITATMSNGVLKLVLPKAEKAKPKKIEIKFS
ncbi:MAG: Hsp20/alpha crystallin family protein [Pseudomonadota bacterium]